VKEHGIIMQPESVRAIIDGRKTQTRRLIRKQDRKRLKFVGRPGDDQDYPCNWGCFYIDREIQKRQKELAQP